MNKEIKEKSVGIIIIYFWELKLHAQTLLSSKLLFSSRRLVFEPSCLNLQLAFKFLAQKPVSRN